MSERPEFTLISTINNEVATLNKNNIRLNAIGDIASLPQKCIDDLKSAMDQTANNTSCTLTLALSYSAKWEIHCTLQVINTFLRQ